MTQTLAVECNDDDLEDAKSGACKVERHADPLHLRLLLVEGLHVLPLTVGQVRDYDVVAGTNFSTDLIAFFGCGHFWRGDSIRVLAAVIISYQI